MPWEEVRSLAWEARRTRELCFGDKAAYALRYEGGLTYLTGPTESRMMVAIDLVRMIDKMASEIGGARRERFFDWVAGTPVAKLREVEQIQLKHDVQRLEQLAIEGGYRHFLLQRRDITGAGE